MLFVGPLPGECLDAFGAPGTVRKVAEAVLVDLLLGGHGRRLDAFELTDILRSINLISFPDGYLTWKLALVHPCGRLLCRIAPGPATFRRKKMIVWRSYGSVIST